jgi:uncharacterized protein
VTRVADLVALSSQSMAAPPTRPRPRELQRPGQPGAPNYFLRRVGAVAILIAIVYALVRMVGSLVEGDASADSVASAESAPGNGGIDCADAEDAALCTDLGLGEGATVTVSDALTADQVETEITQPVVTEPDEPEDTGPPSPSNPATVYIVGDSDAGTFGPYLQTLLDGTLLANTQLNYKVSSGLARPDFFDWPKELAAKLPEVDPDIVVVTFGGNDSQGLSKPQSQLEWVVNDPLANQAEWSAEYERRVGEVMDLLLEDDRRVIWVGIPNDDNPDVSARLQLQDTAAKAAAAARPGVIFIDTWKRFSGRDGGWAEFVIDPRDGTGKDVRAEDGFHLNQTGAEILAIDIAVAAQEELRDLGASI